MYLDKDKLPQLCLRKVSFKFNDKVNILKDIDRCFSGPGIVHILGSNGSGKSTVGKLLAGQLKPNSGNITVKTTSYNDIHRRKVAYCPTEVSLFSSLTVRDHLEFSQKIKLSTQSECNEFIHYFSLDSWIDVKTSELSEGNKRKLWLILCLIGYWEIAVLDEPYISLDKETADSLDNLINRYAESQLIFLISHNRTLEFSVQQWYLPDCVEPRQQ